MRLWHKDLIKYLPKQQLLGQWRELCLIASLLAKDHTPNHILVNPIIDYPPEHFEFFCCLVIDEMKRNNFQITDQVLMKLQTDVRAWRIFLGVELPFDHIEIAWGMKIDGEVFGGWHNDRYLNQCYFNLEEKYDRGGIPEKEWMPIFANFGRYI